MVKYSYLILFACLLCGISEAQQIAPGGVKGAAVWYAVPKGETTWQSCFTFPENSPQWPINDQALLNYNPGLWIDQHLAPGSISINDLDLNQATFFTIYQAADSTLEKSIWHLSRSDSTRLVLSTQRLADLQQWNYLNFSEVQTSQPSLNTYQLHTKTKSQADNQTLHLGSVPTDQALPLVAFQGLLPELIIFDRVINPEERLRVESYLAIKYGLSLQQQDYVTYLNTSGDTIWNGRHYADFSNYITGIGRDDATGLNQLQSSCSYEPGFLTIAIEAQPQDQAFLLWGDNRQTLELSSREMLQPAHLKRQWRMQATNISAPLTSTVWLDSKRLQNALPPGQTYWFIIDPSSEGNFSGPNLSFYPANTLSPSGLATFTDIEWQAGIHAFTFGVGPEMMVTSQIEAPQCQEASEGQLSLRILGGRAPYQCHLQPENGQNDRHWKIENNNWSQALNLPAGSYSFSVEDADGRLYRETFFLQAADAPVAGLEREYTLPAQGQLVLDAGEQLDESNVTYHWITPDGQESYRAQLAIETPGTYRLIIDRQGCRSQQDIQIKSPEEDPFLRVQLFPNPSPDGQFQLRVLLRERATAKLAIYDANGQIMQNQRASDNDYYLFSGKLEQAGVYLFTLTSGNKTISRKLIVP
ncbi:MAG: hypothetical protein DHS20C18_20410 [Saprospiraceae bacterium]|nr:MAG: hypothetical protein DHS20C18_20410 [Saprospiraceae bacterium]